MSIQQHPDYHEGFFDALDGEPISLMIVRRNIAPDGLLCMRCGRCSIAHGKTCRLNFRPNFRNTTRECCIRDRHARQ
jgi:hypothetical protein